MPPDPPASPPTLPPSGPPDTIRSVRLLALAAGQLSLAVIVVCLGAYLDVAALSMPGVLLAILSVIPLLAGVTRLIWPDQTAPDARDGLLG